MCESGKPKGPTLKPRVFHRGPLQPPDPVPQAPGGAERITAPLVFQSQPPPSRRRHQGIDIPQERRNSFGPRSRKGPPFPPTPTETPGIPGNGKTASGNKGANQGGEEEGLALPRCLRSLPSAGNGSRGGAPPRPFRRGCRLPGIVYII